MHIITSIFIADSICGHKHTLNTRETVTSNGLYFIVIRHYMIWYNTYNIWYDMMYMIWYKIWYMIWYNTYNIWYDMMYMIWYKIWYMIWYDMIYLLTANGLTPYGSSTVHIYTQTIHRITQLTILVGRLSGIRTQSGQTKINVELTA